MSRIEIRSYRTVFDLERRIYRIDRLRLNPAGVPIRGLLYCLALSASVLLMARLPLLGALLRLIPWYLRDLLLPMAGAGLLAMVRVEGRPFHFAARALLRYAVGPRHLACFRRLTGIGENWQSPAIVILADGSDGRLRRLRCRGPGVVFVATAHERSERELGVLARLGRRPQLMLAELIDNSPPLGAQPIELARSTSLRVR